MTEKNYLQSVMFCSFHVVFFFLSFLSPLPPSLPPLFHWKHMLISGHAAVIYGNQDLNPDFFVIFLLHPFFYYCATFNIIFLSRCSFIYSIVHHCPFLAIRFIYKEDLLNIYYELAFLLVLETQRQIKYCFCIQGTLSHMSKLAQKLQ